MLVINTFRMMSIKTLLANFLLVLIFSIKLQTACGQFIEANQEDHFKGVIGGELKGMYISGGISVLGGATLGIISNGFNDYPRTGLPFIASGLTLAPSTLLGLGIGSLFAKNHSHFTRTFQVGLGVAYSSPIFSEFVPGNAHRAGINIRILSSEIGKWRYNLGFNKFFSEVYEFDRIQYLHGHNDLSWWELNLDLQYLIYLTNHLKIYPFIGTQYNRVNSSEIKIKTEVLVNYGVGLNVKMYKDWSLFAEMKLTIDPDDNPGNMIYSFGTLYYL